MAGSPANNESAGSTAAVGAAESGAPEPATASAPEPRADAAPDVSAPDVSAVEPGLISGGPNTPSGRIRSFGRRVVESGLPMAALAPGIAAIVSLILIIPTLAPGVANWDTAEFQAVAPVLGTAHPTGYPAYVIVGWLASLILQFGDPAYRMNLLQAIFAAGAIAATVAIVQMLTRMRWIALATGLLLAWTQLFWRLSTHADPHMFHVALVGAIFALLIAWERRRVGDEKPDSVTQPIRWLLAAGFLYAVAVGAGFLPAVVAGSAGLAFLAVMLVLVLVWEAVARRNVEAARHADRWLIAAACVYGVAVANHSLALLLPPAIGLFVLAVDPRIVLRPRTIALCVAVLGVTIVGLFLELPIRAAMNAPLVYGHPNTWSGFTYVVLAEQFRGSLMDPLGNLPAKAAGVVDLMSGWLGPLGYLSMIGVATSLIRRPRFVLLSGMALVVTCGFAASYANADIQRYYLVPLMIAFVWIGLGAADLVTGYGWLADQVQRRSAELAIRRETMLEAAAAATREGAAPAVTAVVDAASASASASDPTVAATVAGRESTHGASPALLAGDGLGRGLVLVAQIAVAAALVWTSIGIVPERMQVPSAAHPGGVSETNNTSDEHWMRAVLAPADQGGLPTNSVIMAWWSTSTTLWYGQKVEGLRPDITVIDDSTRVNDNLGTVQDVFNSYLGKRPVFTIRLQSGVDGMDALNAEYDIHPFMLENGSTIYQVVGRKGSS